MEDSSTSQLNDGFSSLGLTESSFPPALKFILNNISRIVTTQLSNDNYPIWKSQVLKLFRANAYEGFLDEKIPCPLQFLPNTADTSTPNPAHRAWTLLDQNLSSAICSTVTTAILPYIINLQSTHEIWTTLERRLQATNRSRILQLKNELNTVSMKTQSLSQYLTHIKTTVDHLQAAGAHIDAEDIILYTLNGLPIQYQGFKTTIRNTLQPISLDDFYALLCSEEININRDNAMLPTPTPDSSTALYATRGTGRSPTYRGRGRWQSSRGRRGGAPITAAGRGPPTQCQICMKLGHTAMQCWHRLNPNYVQPSSTSSTALTATQSPNNSDWFLDSGASTHLTNTIDNIQQPQPYQGIDHISVGNGATVPIHHTGQGLLPTPTSTLHLSNILHAPSLSHNLLSVSNLTSQNSCYIIFSSNGFVIKDSRSHKVLLHGPSRHGL